MTDIPLRILLQAQNQASSVVKSLFGDLKGLDKALVGVAVAGAGMAVAIGVEAVKKASDFQNAMLQNVAHAGLAKDQFNAVSAAVLNMATDVGQMPTDLAQGLYPILSGFSGITDQSAKAQTALEDLRLAAEDVAGTETKTTVTSGALTAAYNALGLQTNDTATNISRLKTLNDEMEATIIAGNMHWDTYANVVGKLSTSIKGTGVSFQEASAGLATMTNEGFTAQRSQTYLANLFTQLDLKTDSLAKNAKKLGVVFNENKFKSMSLSDQLNYLKDITGGNNSEVLKLLNNNATALKTYNALESGMKTYKSSLDSIKNSHGATASAFTTASSSFKMAGDRMKSAIDVLLIDLGTQLLPILSKVLDWVTPLIKNFANWVLTNQDLHKWLSNVGGFLQNTFFPAVQNTWNAVSNLVTWFQKTPAAAQALQGILVTIGGIIAGMKVAGLAQDIAGLGQKAMDFATNAGPKLLNTLLGTGGLADAEAAVGKNAGTAALAIEGEGTAAAGAAPEEAAAAGAGAGLTGSLIALAPAILGVSFAASQLIGWIDSQKLPGEQMTIGDQAALLKSQTHGLAGGLLGFGPNPLTNPNPNVNSEQLPPSMLGHHASGILNNPVGHFAIVGEHGPEPMYVPQGASILPNGSSFGGGPTINISINTMAGSRSEVQRMVDLIEAELAQRFRSQTGNYATGGTF